MTGTAVYERMTALLNETTASEAGFAERISPTPYEPPAARPDPVTRNAAIRDFNLTLAQLWLGGEWPCSHRAPVWGGSVPAADLEACDPEWLVPCFVRTDENLHGEVYELQCSGGWWGIAQGLHEVFRPGDDRSLAAAFAEEVTELFPDGARILHLFDTAGLPHDSLFFAQRVRAAGKDIRYRGIDAGVFPADCNFVRAHSYGGVVAQDHFRFHLRELAERRLRFDHPPLPIFDQKLPMALPFDAETAHHFTDAHRALFPHTALVRNGAVVLSSGEEVALEDLLRRPADNRRYYLKYAGMDPFRNYGARGVYDLSRSDPEVLRALPKALEEDGEEPWILQEDRRHTAPVSWVGRHGDLACEEMTVRLSGFHGPRRELGAILLAQSSSTIRGGGRTVVGLVGEPAAETGKGGKE